MHPFYPSLKPHLYKFPFLYLIPLEELNRPQVIFFLQEHQSAACSVVIDSI